MTMLIREKMDFDDLLHLYHNCTGTRANILELKRKTEAAIKYSTAKASIPIALYEKNSLCSFLLLHINAPDGFLGEDTAYFSNLFSINDGNVFQYFMQNTESIARQHGCRKIVGPVHDSILIERGIPDFEAVDIPVGMPAIPKYLLDHLIIERFIAVQNLIEIKCGRNWLRRHKLMEWIKNHLGKISFLTLNSREINFYIQDIKNLFNKAWKENWGFRELSTIEVELACKAFENNNNTAVLAIKDSQLVGIAMAAQDMTLSIGQDTLWRAYLIGVEKNFRRKGLAICLFSLLSTYLVKEYSAKKFSCCWMLETNRNVLSTMRKLLLSNDSVERRYSIMGKIIED